MRDTIQRYRLKETGDKMQPFYEGGYVHYADYLAEVTALKAELAEAEDWNKTSKEHQEHWLGRFVEAQRRRIDALKLELAEARKPLTWRRITPENLPKKGDELYSKYGEVHATQTERSEDAEHDVARFNRAGWTHFRSINPPQEEASRTAPSEGRATWLS
jgi:hypothetical protein